MPSPQLAPLAAAPAPSAAQLILNPQARISSSQFQDQWKILPIAHQYEERGLSPATLNAMAGNERDKAFSQHMQQAHVMTMASGGQAPLYKFYFYGQVVGSGSPLFFIELVVRTDSMSASVTIKTSPSSSSGLLLSQFLELWKMLLVGFCR